MKTSLEPSRLAPADMFRASLIGLRTRRLRSILSGLDPGDPSAQGQVQQHRGGEGADEEPALYTPPVLQRGSLHS